MVEVGRRAGGGKPPLAAEHLPPAQADLLADRADLEALRATGFSNGKPDEVEVTCARRENLARDAALVDRLREEGFQGPQYAMFTAALASYGLAVMRAWIRHGEIFRLVAGRSRPVTAPDHVREFLAGAAGDDDRQELAIETTAQALHHFREDALVNGRWSFEGGATLNTFFAGSCILAFPNVYRAWLAQEYEPRRQLRRYDMPPDDQKADTYSASDPAVTAIRNSVLASALDLATDPRVRQAVGMLALTAPEYNKIAQLVGMTEDALKQALSRYRHTARAAREELSGG